MGRIMARQISNVARLPKQRYNMSEVCQLTGLSRETILKRIKNNSFPKPVDKAREYLFRANDIDKYLNGIDNDAGENNQPRFTADAFNKAKASQLRYNQMGKGRNTKSVSIPTQAPSRPQLAFCNPNPIR